MACDREIVGSNPSVNFISRLSISPTAFTLSSKMLFLLVGGTPEYLDSLPSN